MVAWAVLQSAGNSGSGTTIGVAYGTALSAGSTLIAAVSAASNGTTLPTTSSVKDTAGNSFVQLAVVSGAATSGASVSLWALDVPAGDVGGTPTITATASGSTGGYSIVIQEVAGLLPATTSAQFTDGTAQTLGGSAGGSVGPPSYASTAAGEYLVYLYGDSGASVTWTVPAGYTADPNGVNSSGNADIEIAYKSSTGGTEAGQYSLSGAANWEMILVALNIVPAGGGVTGTTTPGRQPGGRNYRRRYRRRQRTPQTGAAPVAVYGAGYPTVYGGAGLLNGFDGGSNGSAIVAATSGYSAGVAFDSIAVTNGATAVYSSAQAAHGPLSGAFTTAATAGTSYVTWAASVGGAQPALYGRVYVYLTADPVADTNIVSFYNGGTFGGGVMVASSGQLRIQNASFGEVGGGPTLPLGQWFRLEFAFTAGPAGAASATVNYYASPDSATITSTLADTAGAYGSAGGINTVNWGWTSPNASQPALYLDSVGVSSSGYLGPDLSTGAAAGVTATAAGAAPAGVMSASSTVVGATAATAAAAAAAGAPSASAAVTGATATAAAASAAGTLTWSGAVAGAAAGAGVTAPSGTPAWSGTVSGAISAAAATAAAGTPSASNTTTGAIAAAAASAPAGQPAVPGTVAGITATAAGVAAAGTLTWSGAVAGTPGAVTATAPAGAASATAGGTVTGVLATAAAAAAAGHPTVPGSVTGILATAAATAAAGATATGEAVTGVLATGAAVAAAGTLTWSGAVTGITASVTVTAPAGTPSTAAVIPGVLASASVSAATGTVTAASAVGGITASVTVTAPAGVPGIAGVITVVQSGTSTGTPGLMLGANVTAGNSVFYVTGCYNDDSSAMSSSAPTLGGAPVPGAVLLGAQQTIAGGGGYSAYVAVWLLPAVTGGSGALSVTFANALGASGCWALEVSGLGSSPAPGTPVTGTGSVGTAGSAGPVSVLPTAAFTVSALTAVTAAMFTGPAPAPWTSLVFDAGNMAGGYQLTAAAGTLTFTPASTPSGDWAGVIAPVYASSTGGTNVAVTGAAATATATATAGTVTGSGGTGLNPPPGGTTVTVDFRTAANGGSPKATDPLGVGFVCTEFGGNPVPLVGNTTWNANIAALAPGHIRCSVAWYNGNPGVGAGGSGNHPGTATALINTIKSLGAIPLVSFNGDTTDNTFVPASGGLLVHYFNDNGGQNGGPVQYWSVGNEPDNTGGVPEYEVGSGTGSASSALAAMLAASPGINVGLPAAAFWDTSLLSWAAGLTGIGTLSYHAYDGGNTDGTGFPTDPQMYTHLHTDLPAMKSGISYGVEECNWTPSYSGQSQFFDWHNTCFIADNCGQALSAGGHLTIYGDSNGALGLMNDGSGQQGQPGGFGTRFPAYWGLGIWTGMNGQFKRYSAHMVPASTTYAQGVLTAFACDNGKIVLVNKDSTAHTVTIGMGGVVSGTYNVWATQASAPTSPITKVVAGVSFSGSVITYTVPAQTAVSVDVTPAGVSAAGVTGVTATVTVTAPAGSLPGRAVVNGVTAAVTAAAAAGAASSPVLLRNGFNAGTSGTAITAGASGYAGGNAFDGVGTAGGTSVYSNAQVAHGTVSGAFSTPAGGGTASVYWQSSLGPQGVVYGRAYCYLSAAPAVDDGVIAFSNGGAWGGAILFSSTLQLRVQTQAYAETAIPGVTLPAGAWFRVEWAVTAGAAGAASLTVSYYASMDSTTATATYTDTAGAYGSGTPLAVGEVSFGWNASHPSQPALYLDSLALSNTGYLGPDFGSVIPGVTAAVTVTAPTGSLAGVNVAVPGPAALAAVTAAAGSATVPSGTVTVSGVTAAAAVAAFSGTVAGSKSAPLIPVFPAGYEPLPSDFGNWVQTPLAALTQKVVFRAVKTTTQSLPVGSRVLLFDTILEDPYNGWDPSVSAWTPPAGWSGIYLITLGVYTAAVAGAKIAAQLGINGTAVTQTLNSSATFASSANAAVGEVPIALVGAQDTVRAIAYTSVATSVSTTPGQQCELQIVWIGY
jgi:hypothetical protein